MSDWITDTINELPVRDGLHWQHRGIGAHGSFILRNSAGEVVGGVKARPPSEGGGAIALRVTPTGERISSHESDTIYAVAELLLEALPQLDAPPPARLS